MYEAYGHCVQSTGPAGVACNILNSGLFGTHPGQWPSRTIVPSSSRRTVTAPISFKSRTSSTPPSPGEGGTGVTMSIGKHALQRLEHHFLAVANSGYFQRSDLANRLSDNRKPVSRGPPSGRAQVH